MIELRTLKRATRRLEDLADWMVSQIENGNADGAYEEDFAKTVMDLRALAKRHRQIEQGERLSLDECVGLDQVEPTARGPAHRELAGDEDDGVPE